MQQHNSKRSRVAVVQVGRSVQEAVREAMTLASYQHHLERGKVTALKVNLGWDLFIPGSITSPWVLEGVIQTIRDWVGPLFVVESDQVLENIQKAFDKSRFQEICDRYGVKWLNMSHSDTVTVPVPEGTVFQSIEIPRILMEAQLVTIPVMKTHAKTGMTGAIKNQWGCISKMRHQYHLVLPEALADINSVIRPAFAVVDATIGLEGNGPKSGRPRIVNRILASSDPVAVDAVQADMMGLQPSAIEHLTTSSKRCLGTNDLQKIEIVGDRDYSRLDFQKAKHNLVSRVEEILRRSRWKKLFFDSPVFLLMLAGAKVWYFVWFYAVAGRKHWQNILSHSFYGKEWRWIREGKE